MPWQSSIQGFRAHLLLERGLSANTIAAYVGDIAKLADFCCQPGRSRTPSTVQTEDLLDFLQMLAEIGLGRRSQARLLSALKTFYKYLAMENLIVQNPTELLEGPRILRTIPATLTVAEVRRILAAVDVSTPHGLRNRAILETLYACGIRVSELCALRTRNINTELGFIIVLGKGNKERLVPIGEEALRQIELYKVHVRDQLPSIQPADEPFLFLNRRGKKLSRVMVFNIVVETARAAGIKKPVSPHTFRHSFATHLIEGGADLKAVQDMLGHESILTTEVYTHLDNAFLRETLLRFHPSSRHYGGGEEEYGSGKILEYFLGGLSEKSR